MLSSTLNSRLLWPLLTLWTLLAAAQDPDFTFIPMRSHSFTTPYLDVDMQSRWFDFGGDAIVRADRYIRLAADRPSQSGYISSRVALTATNWQVEVEFQIHGNGNLFGDGMAMWVTVDRAQQGDVFGSRDNFEGLGIFIDTYKNNRPGVVFPYVMAMLGDGQTAYDKGNDGKANELAGCSVRGIRNTEFPSKARITYFQDKSLAVQLMYKKEGEWTDCFEVPGVKLPPVTYLGFSAATGELSDNFDIIKVETKNLYSPSRQKGASGGAAGSKEFSKSKGRPPKQSNGGGGGWTWFFLKFVIFGLVLTGAWVGFTVYRARQRDRF